MNVINASLTNVKQIKSLLWSSFAAASLQTCYICSLQISLLLYKYFRAHFKCSQVKTYVKTAREFYDLDMDFRSFDNDFKHFRA